MTATSSDRACLFVRLNPLAGAVAVAAGSITATIDTQAATGGYYDEEMVVTSTRRNANVQDIPFNMAAFSGDTLEKQRLTNLSEFARWVPGLTFTDQGQRASSLLTVRGLNASSIQAQEALGNSGGDTVATYVGEIPVWVDLKPYDMERVEVLIGPQGTLYGASTLAGAVRFIPAKPDLNDWSVDTHLKTYLQKESDDLGIGGDIALNVPIINDVLGFRGVLGFVDEPGFIDYNYLVQNAGVSNPEPDLTDGAAVAANLAQRKDANDEKTINARASLSWDVYDALNLYLRYDYQNKKVGARNINHMKSFDTDRYVAGHRFLEPNKRENHIVEFSLTWDFNFAELTSATGYSNYSEDGNRDQTDLLLNFEYGYEDFPAFAAWTRDTDDQSVISQELRLVSQHGGPINWLAGAFYSNFNQKTYSAEFAPGIPEFFGLAPPMLPTGDIEYLELDRIKTKEQAIFGEVGWQILQRWQATIGGRWYDYEKDTSISVDLPLLTNGMLFFPYERLISKDDGIIGKFNTSVDLDGWIPGMSQGTAYVTVSEGYRIGGGNLFAQCSSVPPPAGQNVCLTPDEVSYEPDETVNYELGLKSTWWDDAILLNIAAFYIDWSDVQLETISQFGDVPITTNASDAQSLGIELQSSVNLYDRFRIFGSYAYTQAELAEDAPSIVGVRNALPEDAFDGDRLPATPEHQGSLNFNYTQPLNGALELGIDYGFVFQSDVYTKVGMRGRGEALPGFTVHHLSTGLTGETWTVRLFIDNLFDKYAVTGVRADRDFIDKRADGNGIGTEQFTLRRYYYNVLRPRTIGVDFTIDFDL